MIEVNVPLPLIMLLYVLGFIALSWVGVFCAREAREKNDFSGPDEREAVIIASVWPLVFFVVVPILALKDVLIDGKNKG